MALRQLATSSTVLGYFPTIFKKAAVVVLCKPGKLIAQFYQAGGWQPISLLSCIGKVLEGIIAIKITAAVEECGILLLEQFGNRAGRSTELAARVVIKTVKAAWASLLTILLL